MTAVPRLTLVTDRHATGGRPLVEVVAAALAGAGGLVPPADIAVQLREKDLEGRSLTELARALRALTAASGAHLYINDRVDVALAVGADGVHLGGRSLDPAAAARIAPGLTIGVSTHGAAEVAAAARSGAQFAFLGPIADTPAKRRFGPPLGANAISDAARTGLPIVAIGGVTPADVPALLAAGAHGVACIRAVLGADDPRRALQEFCKQLCAASPPDRHRPAKT